MVEKICEHCGTPKELRHVDPQTGSTIIAVEWSCPIRKDACSRIAALASQNAELMRVLEGPEGDTLMGWAGWLEDRAEAFDPYMQGPLMRRVAAWFESLDETLATCRSNAQSYGD